MGQANLKASDSRLVAYAAHYLNRPLSNSIWRLPKDIEEKELFSRMHIKSLCGRSQKTSTLTCTAVSATCRSANNLIQRNELLWKFLLKRDFGITSTPTSQIIRTWKDVYKMNYLGRDVPIDFSDRPLSHKIGIGFTATLLSPVILVYLSPKIIRATWRKAIIPGYHMSVKLSKDTAVYIEKKVIEPVVDKIVIPTHKYAKESIEYLTENIFIPFLKLLKFVLVFLFVKIPREIYTQIIPPLLIILKGLLRFFLYEIPIEIFKQIIDPFIRYSFEVLKKALEILFIKVPREIYNQIIPGYYLLCRVLRFYFIQLPCVLWNEAINPFRLGMIKNGNRLREIVVPKVLKFWDWYQPILKRQLSWTYDNIIYPSLQKTADFSRATSKIAMKVATVTLRTILYVFVEVPIRSAGTVFWWFLVILKFFFIRLPTEMWNKILVPGFNLARLATKFLYEKALTPLGWFILRASRVAYEHLVTGSKLFFNQILIPSWYIGVNIATKLFNFLKTVFFFLYNNLIPFITILSFSINYGIEKIQYFFSILRNIGKTIIEWIIPPFTLLVTSTFNAIKDILLASSEAFKNLFFVIYTNFVELAKASLVIFQNSVVPMANAGKEAMKGFYEAIVGALTALFDLFMKLGAEIKTKFG